MGKANEALDEIARIRGISVEQARAFCNEVQKCCHRVPPFALIALAVSELGPNDPTPRAVAERANASQGWAAGNLVSREESPCHSSEIVSILE